MKMIFIIFTFMFFVNHSHAVCVSPLSRTDLGFKTILSSSRYNSELNIAFNRANNLPGDCIVDGTITSAKLANNSITTSKISDGSITAAKIATDAIPESGRLIRIVSITSSTTWTKGSDVGSIMVQVVGGGGASYHASSTNGGSSSFGTHCVAGGGSKPSGSSTSGGSGGSSSNGDINLSGGNGEVLTSFSGIYYGGGPGYSVLGNYGRGGFGALPTFFSPGGGAGAYCAKLIDDTELAATETVTIGAGGTNPGTNTTPGNAGFVVIYEYSK